MVKTMGTKASKVTQSEALNMPGARLLSLPGGERVRRRGASVQHCCKPAVKRTSDSNYMDLHGIPLIGNFYIETHMRFGAHPFTAPKKTR